MQLSQPSTRRSLYLGARVWLMTGLVVSLAAVGHAAAAAPPADSTVTSPPADATVTSPASAETAVAEAPASADPAQTTGTAAADSAPPDPAQGSTPAATADDAQSGTQEPETIGTILGSDTSELDRVEVQIEAREFDPAQRWLESHVEALERGSHRYDPTLIRPLILLGDANMGKSQYVEALALYQRATHLTRVNTGLKSLDQIPIVYREANAYKALGQYEEANDREEYAYQILAGQAAPNDPALLPALYRLADWYMASGNAFAARGLYERAIRTLMATGQGEREAAIPALQGLAASYRLERFPTGYAASQQTAAMASAMDPDQPIAVSNFPAGEQALQQVVRIRQQSPDGDPMDLIEAVLDLADWYTLFEKPQRADPLYAHAYELLGQIPDADRAGYFAQPRLLYIPDPGSPRNQEPGPAGESRTGFVEVAYTVSATGYVRDPETIASEPDGLMDIRVRRSLRVARYRPALVDGVPIASANLTYRHEFSYWAEPEEEPEDQTRKASEQSNPEVVKQ